MRVTYPALTMEARCCPPVPSYPFTPQSRATRRSLAALPGSAACPQVRIELHWPYRGQGPCLLQPVPCPYPCRSLNPGSVLEVAVQIPIQLFTTFFKSI